MKVWRLQGGMTKEKAITKVFVCPKLGTIILKQGMPNSLWERVHEQQEGPSPVLNEDTSKAPFEREGYNTPIRENK